MSTKVGFRVRLGLPPSPTSAGLRDQPGAGEPEGTAESKGHLKASTFES